MSQATDFALRQLLLQLHILCHTLCLVLSLPRTQSVTKTRKQIKRQKKKKKKKKPNNTIVMPTPICLFDCLFPDQKTHTAPNLVLTTNGQSAESCSSSACVASTFDINLIALDRPSENLLQNSSPSLDGSCPNPIARLLAPRNSGRLGSNEVTVCVLTDSEMVARSEDTVCVSSNSGVSMPNEVSVCVYADAQIGEDSVRASSSSGVLEPNETPVCVSGDSKIVTPCEDIVCVSLTLDVAEPN